MQKRNNLTLSYSSILFEEYGKSEVITIFPIRIIKWIFIKILFGF